MFTLNTEKKTAQFHDVSQQFVMFIVASQMNPIKESSKTILTIFFLEKSPTYKDMSDFPRLTSQ